MGNNQYAHLQPLLADLIEVCQNFTLKMEAGGDALLTKQAQASLKLVFPEPYVPFLPSKAPKILVLAESQNLSKASQPAYVSRLEKTDPSTRFLRLIHGKEDQVLGIQPWDDGILKRALQAALQVDWTTVAVSNAIPWSWVQKKANARPFTSKVIDMAGDFWRAIFEKWTPDLVVAAGAVARDVMAKTGLPSDQVLNWALPSPRLKPAALMFESFDLMRRFEISEQVQQQVRDADKALQDRLAFYVCHAVSKTREFQVTKTPENPTSLSKR